MQELFYKLLTEHKIVLLLGATDTGKTTFIHKLINFFLTTEINKNILGVIDADIGQSDIGPPSTVGLAIVDKRDYKKPIEDYRELKLEAFEFLGAFSPAGCIPELIFATRYMVDIAKEKGAETILIDTTGLVFGTVGIRLKQLKIRVVSPDAIVAIEKNGELEHILRPFSDELSIYRILPYKEISTKDYTTRRLKRETELNLYFKNSSSISLEINKLAGLPYHNQDIPPLFCNRALTYEEIEERKKKYRINILYGEVFSPNFYPKFKELLVSDSELYNIPYDIREDIMVVSPSYFVGKLVGLYKNTKELLALGIIKEIDFSTLKINIITPLKEEEKEKIRLIKLSPLSKNE